MSNSERPSLIREIQSLAISGNVNVSGLLRRAKVAAVKLGQDEATRWIDSEIDGYACPFDELPIYRKTYGVLKARSPYYGLLPVQLLNEETDEILTRAPTKMGIGTVQSLLSDSDKNGQLIYRMSALHRKAILDLLEEEVEPVLFISRSQLQTVLDSVLSLVLNWSLELEKAGILGEGMSFDMNEKRKAGQITQNFFAHNIGHVGQVSDSGQSSISQNSYGDFQLDQRRLESLVDQANSAVPLLPKELQDEIRSLLMEIGNSESSAQKIGLLGRAKNILEGASGNLAAEGIIRLITSITG